jgi:hypothetical protein
VSRQVEIVGGPFDGRTITVGDDWYTVNIVEPGTGDVVVGVGERLEAVEVVYRPVAYRLWQGLDGRWRARRCGRTSL